jgi:PAS domain S-box-containing protein
MVLSDPHLPDCPMIVVNQAFARATGYDPLDITGHNCRFLQGPKTDPGARRRIRACLEAGQGCIEWLVNYRRDGSEFWNLLFISPVYGPDGALLFFFGNQLDITKGFPDWLTDVQLGRAHVVPALEAEFHALLQEITLAERVQALERIVAAAHRLAEISVSLAPGTLEAFKTKSE